MAENINIPQSLATYFGAPLNTDPVQARWNIRELPTAKALVPQGDSGDWRPAIQAALQSGVPVYFDKGRYVIRSRVDANTAIELWNLPNVDVLCHPEAEFVLHERIFHADPNAYDANTSRARDGALTCVFRFGARSGQNDSYRPSLTNPQEKFVWVGGRFDMSENIKAQTNADRFGLVSWFDLFHWDDFEFRRIDFDGGTVAVSGTASRFGMMDSMISTHACGDGIIDFCNFVGSEDVAVYLNGDRNPVFTLPTNPLEFNTGTRSVIVTYTSLNNELGQPIIPAVGDMIAVGNINAVSSANAGNTQSVSGTYTITFVDTAAKKFRFDLDANPSYTATGGGTGVKIALMRHDLSEKFHNNVSGLGQRVTNCTFYRCRNPLSYKRNAQFAEAYGNFFMECENGIQAAGVGFTPGGNDTDWSSFGKRLRLHHNVYIRIESRAISLLGTKGAHVSNEHIVDYGRWISQAGWRTGSSKMAAIWLRACDDVLVSNCYIAQEDDLYTTNLPASDDDYPVGIYLTYDPNAYDASSRNCEFSHIRMRNVGWTVREETNSAVDCVYDYVPMISHTGRVATLNGTDSRVTPEFDRTYTPTITFSNSGSTTTYGVRTAKVVQRGKWLDFNIVVSASAFSTAPAPSGTVIVSGLPANKGPVAAIHNVLRSGGSGAGTLIGRQDPGTGNIVMFLDSNGGLSGLTSAQLGTGNNLYITGRFQFIA